MRGLRVKNEEEVVAGSMEMAAVSVDMANEWIDIESRRLFIDREITETILGYVGYYITRWNEEDSAAEAMDPEYRRPVVRMYINSPGGDLLATMVVCDIMQSSTTPINTYGQACSFSAAGLLLMSGHRRFAWRHSAFLYHAGSMELGGSLTSVHDTMSFYKKYFESVREYVLEITNIDAEEYERRYREEWYMTAKDMLHYGIIDEIIGVVK